jgi:UDP-N-acetylglucosamine--N-acetylmuramyl-(pentapeptide) pyrophosphoryl-undecaprenol N-acetylglucosamine transferase
MAGGGTGGHVVPSLAVAAELRTRGHEVFFIGTRAGFEARLVPERGFPMEWIEIGGLKRVGWRAALRTLASLPGQVLRSQAILARRAASAVFSMGGYVAGPVMVAAWLRRLPMVLMEPNAMPGLTNRWMGRLAARALISFPEAARHFPRGRAELTGLPCARVLRGSVEAARRGIRGADHGRQPRVADPEPGRPRRLAAAAGIGAEGAAGAPVRRRSPCGAGG